MAIECHAGHGLDYETARKISALPQVVELNIGHFLIAEAIFIGLDAAIKKMRAAIDAGRARTRERSAPIADPDPKAKPTGSM